MVTLITIIHVIVGIFLILMVLLQGGKGAGLGAAFGGSSQTVFG
ncbi:MAG: preprotein translocase subunit SecG, partial [Deltaproteobacteria bacterium]|nr:preprotein translocase subunit SecG [Deltaproteobacteria bacterium]